MEDCELLTSVSEQPQEFQEICRALLVEAIVARRHFGFLYLEPISNELGTLETGSVSFVHLAIQLGNRLPCCPAGKFSLDDLLILFGDLLREPLFGSIFGVAFR